MRTVLHLVVLNVNRTDSVETYQSGVITSGIWATYSNGNCVCCAVNEIVSLATWTVTEVGMHFVTTVSQ